VLDGGIKGMTPFFSTMLVMETMKLQTQHGPSSTEPYLLVCPSFLDQIAKSTTIVGQNHHDCWLNYQLLIYSGCPTNKQRLIAYSPRQYTPKKKHQLFTCLYTLTLCNFPSVAFSVSFLCKCSTAVLSAARRSPFSAARV